MSQLEQIAELYSSAERVTPSELAKFSGGVRITPPELSTFQEEKGFDGVERSIWVHRDDLTWSSIQSWEDVLWMNIVGADLLDVADHCRDMVDRELTEYAVYIERRGGDHSQVLIDQEYCDAVSAVPDFLKKADVRLIPASHNELVILGGVKDPSIVSGIELYRAGYEKIPFKVLKAWMLEKFGYRGFGERDIAINLSMRGKHALIIEDQLTPAKPDLKKGTVKVGSLWRGYQDDIPGVFKQGI